MYFPVLAISAWALLAQNSGTITGTVADATNAVIPGAGVTATNTQTTAKYETVSTETGNYTLAQLPAGTYDVEVLTPGGASQTVVKDLFTTTGI